MLSAVYAPHANTYFLFGINLLTVTIVSRSNLTPGSRNSELFKDTATPDPNSFQKSDIFEMFLYSLIFVFGLK